ncbi:serine protease [Poseidonocella sp. HB161398]|uniref:trypsin-like serine peptidase n=1 Tax=Poseidonocella sp. HB161398 TaxID=2320855 RepID=UPI0014861D24|nr:trypsin-like peptidase domain-containing protein [Poseidonocella sp. HB161398]
MAQGDRDRARRRTVLGAVFGAALLAGLLPGLAVSGERGAPRALPAGSARVLLSAPQQAGYSAVGQVRTGPKARHCTATLIAPDLVLTAAHCVSNPGTGWVAQPYRTVFWPAYRKGGEAGAVAAAALAVAGRYLEGAALAEDLALLRLKAPVPAEVARPIPVAEAPLLRGHPLEVLSFGYDAPDALAREAPCEALAPLRGAMVTSCEAVGGMSGAPVIVEDAEGRLRVAAVVSSRLARAGGGAGPGGRAVVVPVGPEALARLAAGLAAPGAQAAPSGG